MGKETMQIGELSKPRFEFRSFGQNFDRIHHRMSRFSVPVPEKVWERHSDEIYIVSRTNDVNNTKIRDGKMDIKTFVQAVDGLEQWNPLMKGEFPLPPDILRNEVFPAFQVTLPPLPARDCSYEAFLELIRTHPDLAAVRVHKQRFGYLVHDTICEYAVVLINGARVVSVATESTEVSDLQRTIVDTGMTGLENINYLQAIKRVLGMSPAPLANACPGGAMAQEIERKFLVKGAFKDQIEQSTRIVQGYLSSVPERTVRVRLKGEKGFLTIKGIGSASGASRFEWEREIPAREAEQLLAICEPGVIDKVRHLVRAGGHTFEVDEFHGENDGLVVAEIELSAEDESFERPVWLGSEVTGDARYYNSMLMKQPYTTWAAGEA